MAAQTPDLCARLDNVGMLTSVAGRESRIGVMEKFRIIGGRPLQGVVSISGAKNSALPCITAGLLAAEPVTLRNVPYVRDIITLRRLLEDLGCTVLTPELNTLKIDGSGVNCFEAPYELVKTMRASVLVLGPLLARFGEVSVSMPGGCAIGERPIDEHISGFEKMGARVELENGNIVARADRLRGAEIDFEKVTVTGTENLMMAACLAKGETVLNNAAREPEIVDLADLLIKMGGQITGAGTATIRISGVEKLHGAQHSIIPDRIETGTFLVAGAITQGHLDVTDCKPEHIDAVLNQLRMAGVRIDQIDDTTLRVSPNGGIKALDIVTDPHPGFPTDMQAQYMALMTQADGTSVIEETIFENRFMHASEMRRLGGKISTTLRKAIVCGVTPLKGARLQASDLRASASLVLAGLAASGETIIDRVYHIDRGYERIEEKLRAVGAEIERLRD